jgi:hypothetical protein
LLFELFSLFGFFLGFLVFSPLLFGFVPDVPVVARPLAKRSHSQDEPSADIPIPDDTISREGIETLSLFIELSACRNEPRGALFAALSPCQRGGMIFGHTWYRLYVYQNFAGKNHPMFG